MRGNSALRRIDRLVGIPALRVIGLRPKRSRPRSLRRVAFLRTAALGDTLLLSGVLRDTAVQLGVDVTLVTGTNNADAGVLVSSGVCDHVVIGERDPFAATRALRRLELDAIVDTGSWPRLDALLAAMSGARFSIGFSTPGQYRHYAYDVAVPHSSTVHETENFRRLASALEVHSASEPTLNAASLPNMQLPVATPAVVFHPWAGGFQPQNREWAEANWLELAGRLAAGTRTTILITGAPSQDVPSRALAERMSAAGIAAKSIAGRYALSELASILAACEGLVSVNTGIAHLAAILGVPTVSLDGPTNSRRWGPRGPRTCSVQSSFSNCGYLDLGFEYDGQRTDCMSGISVDAVELAFRGLTAGATG